MLGFGLNQVTMANAPVARFVETAAQLGMVGVELRNDLAGPVFDGWSAGKVGQVLKDHGLRLLGLSQVYPFDRWTDEVAGDLRALIDVADEAGAETISLIPCNDGSGLDTQARQHNLTKSLEACQPLLDAAGIKALIEPLGFSSATLRNKAELVAALKTLEAESHFQLVHDTFHHALAGGGPIFPNETGIVHISGVVDPTVSMAQMEDKHRVLIDRDDRLGNLEQIAQLQSAGYRGVYSFECFSPNVHNHPSLKEAIKKSMNFISSHMQEDMAA